LHANALKGLCNAAPEARTLEEGKMRNAQQIERVKGHLNTTLKEMGDDPARPRAAGSNLGFKVMGGLNRLEINALMEAGLSRGVRHGLAIRKTLELDITGCGEFFAAASLALKEELSRSTPKRPIRSPPPPRTPLTLSRPPTARPPPEPLAPPKVKPPDNPLDVSFRSRLAAIFGKGKERVQAAKAVAQWFDGDQFKKVAKDHTAVAYGLCGRMRDGTADPHIFGKFNDLVSGGEDLTGETGLTGTGIPELEQHAQALGLSKDEFKEAFFLEFAKRMEKRYPLHDDLVRVVEQGDTAVGPPYALQYVNNFGKLYAVFKNGTKVMHCPLDEQGNPTEWVVAISGDYERKRLRDYIDRRIIGHGNIHFKGVRVPPEWIQKSV